MTDKPSTPRSYRGCIAAALGLVGNTPVAEPGQPHCHCGGVLPPIVFPLREGRHCVTVQCPRCGVTIHCYNEID